MGQIPIPERSIEPRSDTLEPVLSQTGSREILLAYPLSEIVSKIQSAAYASGFKYPLFSVISGYRSIAEQVQLYEQGLKKHGPDAVSKYVAKPGRSSHHTGFAVDINLGYPAKTENIDTIRGTQAYKFMQKEAAKYGLWELPSEPWHWELDKQARDAYLASKQVVINGTDSSDSTPKPKKRKSRGKNFFVGAFVFSSGVLLLAAYTRNKRNKGA